MSNAYYVDEDAEAWLHKVAAELNDVMARADFVEGDPSILHVDKKFVVAARSLCRRVAEFEGIKGGDINPSGNRTETASKHHGVAAVYKNREDGDYDFVAAFTTADGMEFPEEWPKEIAEWLRCDGWDPIIVHSELENLPDVLDKNHSLKIWKPAN